MRTWPMRGLAFDKKMSYTNRAPVSALFLSMPLGHGMVRGHGADDRVIM